MCLRIACERGWEVSGTHVKRPRSLQSEGDPFTCPSFPSFRWVYSSSNSYVRTPTFVDKQNAFRRSREGNGVRLNGRSRVTACYSNPGSPECRPSGIQDSGIAKKVRREAFPSLNSAETIRPPPHCIRPRKNFCQLYRTCARMHSHANGAHRFFHSSDSPYVLTCHLGSSLALFLSKVSRLIYTQYRHDEKAPDQRSSPCNARSSYASPCETDDNSNRRLTIASLALAFLSVSVSVSVSVSA